MFALNGDLNVKGLGFSEQHRAVLINEVQVIINCAASVNFDDPLQEALLINYFGALQLLDIAKQSVSLESFTHVSTAYVNSNREGQIDERVYPVPNNEDPEMLVSRIMRLSR